MSDTTPQTAEGKVLLHFAMSLDGFVAGPPVDVSCASLLAELMPLMAGSVPDVTTASLVNLS